MLKSISRPQNHIRLLHLDKQTSLLSMLTLDTFGLRALESRWAAGRDLLDTFSCTTVQEVGFYQQSPTIAWDVVLFWSIMSA